MSGEARTRGPALRKDSGTGFAGEGDEDFTEGHRVGGDLRIRKVGTAGGFGGGGVEAGLDEAGEGASAFEGEPGGRERRKVES